MKKMLVFMLMLLSVAGMAFAGNLDVADPTFEDGTGDYNGSAIIDADTLEGNPSSYFASLAYVQSNDAKWSKDVVGGSGLRASDLGKYLTGNKDLFQTVETFVDYLKGLFATTERVTLLEARVDALEAHILGLSTEQYQKAKATEIGSYGPYTCSEDICIKKVN